MAFSIPTIAATLFEPLASLIDTALVGHRHSPWLAGLALGTTLLNTLTWLTNFLIQASLQSMAEVASSSEQRRQRLQTGYLFGLIAGVVVALVMILGRDLFEMLLSVAPEHRQDFRDYFYIRSLGHPISILTITSLSMLRGLGQMRTTLWLVVLSCLLNSALSLIFLWPLDLGLFGVGLATVISMSAILALSTYLLLKSNDVRLMSLFENFSALEIKSFSGKSWHLFGRSLALTSCFFIATRIASILGSHSLAIHQIALQFWLLNAWVLDGLAMTATVAIAQLQSQKQHQVIREVIMRLMILGGIISALFALSYLILRQWLWSIFTVDPILLQGLENLWPILAWPQFYLGVCYLLDGIMFGLGKFQAVKWVMVTSVVIGFLPLAYIALEHRSLNLLWWGMAALGLVRLLGGLYVTYKRS
jgi:multidrug resistance protein, MATE family